MKIRAITIGQKIPFLIDDESLESTMKEKLENFFIFNRDLIENLDNLGIKVQTKRICSQPMLSYEQQLYQKNLNETLERLHDQLSILERLIKRYDIDYLAACTLLADQQIPKYGVYEKLFLNEAPQFIKRKEKFFTSLQVASSDNGINLSAIRSAAKIIKNLSQPDPFNNLKFCLSSNVQPDTPFFPAAYHLSEKSSFGLALEMADEVVNAFDRSETLKQAQVNLRISVPRLRN